MGDIAVEQSTDHNPPKLVVDIQSGEVLVLEAIEGAVPGYVSLLF